MICEFYNKISKFDAYLFGKCNNGYRTEVSLTDIIFATFYVIILVLFISWWFIPIKKIFNLMDNVSFKCNKK